MMSYAKPRSAREAIQWARSSGRACRSTIADIQKGRRAAVPFWWDWARLDAIHAAHYARTVARLR